MQRFLKVARGPSPASIPTGLLKKVTDLIATKKWAFKIDGRVGDHSFDPNYKLESPGGVLDMSQYPYDLEGEGFDAASLYGPGA